MIKISMKTVKAGLILAGAHLALFVTAVITGKDGDVPFFYCASLIVGSIRAAPHVPHNSALRPVLPREDDAPGRRSFACLPF